MIVTDQERPRSCAWQFGKLMELGMSMGDSLLKERMKAVRPFDDATIIHTSGTSGVPKGVMLNHCQILVKCLDSCTVPGAGEGGPAVYDAAHVPLLWLCGIRAEFHDGRSSPGLLRENGQNLPFGNAEEGAVHGAVQRTYCLYPPYPGDEGRKGRRGGVYACACASRPERPVRNIP